MHQRLADHHAYCHGNHRFKIGHTHLIGCSVELTQEDGVENRIQQQSCAKQGHIGVHAHYITAVGVDMNGQHRKRHGNDQRGQLDHRNKQHGGLYRVTLTDRQNGGIIHIPLFAEVHKGEENAQRYIEKCHRIGVVGDEQHGAEQAEYQRHRMAHQTKLLI